MRRYSGVAPATLQVRSALRLRPSKCLHPRFAVGKHLPWANVGATRGCKDASTWRVQRRRLTGAGVAAGYSSLSAISVLLTATHTHTRTHAHTGMGTDTHTAPHPNPRACAPDVTTKQAEGLLERGEGGNCSTRQDPRPCPTARRSVQAPRAGR